MFEKFKWFFCLVSFAICVPVLCGREKAETFSLLDSVLLLGTYNDIRIVRPEGVQLLKPPVDIKTNGGYFAFPSISPKGDLVAWGFAIALDQQRQEHRARFALGIYSTLSHEWKTFGNFDQIGYTAFSLDGSKVAFVGMREGKNELLIFDLAAEKLSSAPYPRGMPESDGLSWSPDGKQLAIVVERGEKPSQIAVLELQTGDVRPLGEGYQPAWSPTGEWIAYYAGQKCMVVHPDGTGTRTIKDVSGGFRYRSFNWGLVWSPDGQQLLLNEIKADGPDLRVMLLDLASGKFSKKSDNGLPAFGWASGPKARIQGS
jgi:hypothetical protein